MLNRLSKKLIEMETVKLNAMSFQPIYSKFFLKNLLSKMTILMILEKNSRQLMLITQAILISMNFTESYLKWVLKLTGTKLFHCLLNLMLIRIWRLILMNSWHFSKEVTPHNSRILEISTHLTKSKRHKSLILLSSWCRWKSCHLLSQSHL